MPPSVSQNEPYGSQQTLFLIPYAYQTQVVSSYCYRHPCLITSGPAKVGPPGLSPQEGCPEIRKVRGDLVLKPGFFTFSIKEHPSYYSLSPSAAVPHGNREFPPIPWGSPVPPIPWVCRWTEHKRSNQNQLGLHPPSSQIPSWTSILTSTTTAFHT